MKYSANLLCLALACGLSAQTPKPSTPKERDLKMERDEPARRRPLRRNPPFRGVTRWSWHRKIRDSPNRGNCGFPERDAEAVYSVLISPEGGNFRAENVHRLIGNRATLVESSERDRGMAAACCQR